MDALLLKVPEAAAQLGISRAKLYELISNGALPSVRVDGCRRIRREDLLVFVAKPAFGGLRSGSASWLPRPDVHEWPLHERYRDVRKRR
jgi:excisionase family DNA binding protein